jgi:hypothetical protein
MLAFMLAMGAASAGGAVAIVNGSRTAMVSLQLRPSGSGGWQPNVLGTLPLGVQKATRPIAVPTGTNCNFDIVARYEDGHRNARANVNLCGTSRFVLTDL